VELARRIDRLESRQALWDLVSAYCLAVDDKDVDGLTTVLTDGANFFRMQGTDAIRSFFAGRVAEHDASVHSPHTQLVEFVSDDEATGVGPGMPSSVRASRSG
jgi:hypothetical protein